jgi:archaellum biogenesis protein FlaJ (TadC family)
LNRKIIDFFKLFLIKKFSKIIYSSELNITPQDYISKLMIIILVSLISAILLALFNIILSIFVIIIPIIYICYPIFSVRKRKLLCEQELPFVITYLTIAAASSYSISKAVLNLSSFNFLKAFKKEAERIDRIRRLYALSPIEAIIFESNFHPSQAVRELFSSIVTAERSGESPFLIMRDELIKSFSYLLSRLKVMSDKFSIIASAQMIVFIVIPMAVITISIIFSSIIEIKHIFLSCIVLPCIFALIISMIIDSYYPKELSEPINIKYFLLSLISFPVAIILYYSTKAISFDYLLAITIILFSLPITILYERERRKTKQILSLLPSFSRSIAEEVKKGNSPSRAIILLSENSSSSFFNNLLKRIASYISIGYSISKTISYLKMPWIAKIYFEILEKAEEIGANAKSMSALSDLMNNIYTSMKELESQTSLFKFSCYINSVILPFSITIIVDVIIRIFTNISIELNAYYFGIEIIKLESVPLLSLIAYSCVILNAYLLGLLGGKISNGGSVVDGLKSSIICITIAIITIFILRDMKLINLLFGFR